MEYTLEQIDAIASSAIGKTFGEIDKHNRAAKFTKGLMGHVIEESLYGYEINSNSESDFKNIGVELKVTPVKENKNKTLSAKERLVLNIINYMTEADVEFEESSFWKKNQRLLIIFYLWQKEIESKDYKIIESLLYDYPEEDLEIIKSDWQIIQDKIKSGLAHELSEGDTMYLGACTKGASSKSVRQQPYSDIPAKQRAYSLKQSYMTTLVRKLISQEELVSILSNDELKKSDFETILKDKFEPYIGKTLSEIADERNIQMNQQFKSKVQGVISDILGITGTHLSKIEEFSKANIQFKTIRLMQNGYPRESMSFEQIDFQEWLDFDWEDSQIYQKFEQTKFLFVVFQYNDEDELVFKGVKLWNMPKSTLENEVYDMWKQVRKKLAEGVEITAQPWGESVRYTNNLPKESENDVTHIRPKARNTADKTLLPDGQSITKQTYWLNRNYIGEIVKNLSD